MCYATGTHQGRICAAGQAGTGVQRRTGEGRKPIAKVSCVITSVGTRPLSSQRILAVPQEQSVTPCWEHVAPRQGTTWSLAASWLSLRLGPRKGKQKLSSVEIVGGGGMRFSPAVFHVSAWLSPHSF